VKRFFLLNAAFNMTILDLISLYILLLWQGKRIQNTRRSSLSRIGFFYSQERGTKFPQKHR